MIKSDLTVMTLDEYASEAEVRSALEAQAISPSPRIFAAAAAILNRHPKLKTHISESDLIGTAYSAILGDRNWNKSKVDFVGYVVGVMRSLASDATKKATHTRPQLTYGHEEFDEIDTESATDSETAQSPEDILIAMEDAISKDQRIDKLRIQLSQDHEALMIFDLLLEHGLAKCEIRDKLGINDKQFWAADRRLQRAVAKLGDE